MRLSVVIPSANDPCLHRTVTDILEHAHGDIEVIAVLDGGHEIEVPGATVIYLPQRLGRRPATNIGVAQSHGDFIMKCDSHCSFSDGFDRDLLGQIEDNWVVSPRRYRLNIDTWERTGDPPIDYERIQAMPDKLHGVRWTSRTLERASIPVDENETNQGSCWVMSRYWWDHLGGLSSEGYGTFTQEPEEICLKTWLGPGDGRVMINKLAWYAHKDRSFKRTWHSLPGDDAAKGNAWSRDYWLNNRWSERVHDIEWLAERFGRRM